MSEARCMRCRKLVQIKNEEKVQIKCSRGIRNMLKGVCPECGTKLCKFVK